MKRMLFLLTMILIGANVSFASNKKEKKAENMALYEQAVKAVQEKKFVVKFHTYDGPKRRLKVNNLTNFLMLDGNSTLRQYDDGRRFWGYANGGFPNYESPKMKEGYVSDVLVDIDKNGKVVCTLLYRTEGKPDSFTKIVFKKGSNKCTMIRHSRGLKSYSWGTIHPIGATEIRKAI